MSVPDLLEIYKRLEATGIECIIVGSVASSAYGEPRSTLDIDLLVKADARDAERIRAAFPADRFYVPPLDVMRREIARAEGTFNIIDSETSLKADIYPAGSDPLQIYAFEHALKTRLSNMEVRLAPPTYIIAMKLRYYSISRQDKHLRDIRGILAMSANAVDNVVVDRIAMETGTMGPWLDCRGRVGEE